MYHKEKSIQIKSSASALYNNLSVLRIAPRCLTYFTVVHANVVNMVSASWDGLNYSHRQLQSKEGNVATSSSLIMQVMLNYYLIILQFCESFYYFFILTFNLKSCLTLFFCVTGSLVCPAFKRSSCSHFAERNPGGLSVIAIHLKLFFLLRKQQDLLLKLWIHKSKLNSY